MEKNNWIEITIIEKLKKVINNFLIKKLKRKNKKLKRKIKKLKLNFEYNLHLKQIKINELEEENTSLLQDIEDFERKKRIYSQG